MRLGTVGHVKEVNRSDLDSHADCCVCGKEVLVFNDFDREVTVAGWDAEGETQSLSIVSAAMGYKVPESKINGETVDISTIAEYAWYEWVKFRDTAAKFLVSNIQLGRDLGAAIDIGPAMTRKILKKNGMVMYISSVRSLTQDEIQSPTEQKERQEFGIAIEEKFGPAMNKADFQDDPDYADVVTPTFECYEDDEVPPSKMPDIDDIKKEHDVDTYDQYVGAHVRVPIGDEIKSGKVLRRKRELDGTVRGRANANPMLDTRIYEIEFPDGRSDEYTANVIAENMYAQCDIEGRQFNIMEGIIDHKTDGHAVAPA
jgi:hypothetical protein